MDVVLCETGNGGDFIHENNDFKLTEGMTNFIYIGWFGGNYGGDERDKEDTPQSEQRDDWFGNTLFFDVDVDFRYNSELETTLGKSALNSSSRLLIERVAKGDLDFLGDFGEVEVEASIIDIDKIKITAKINQPDNEENKIFTYIWDSMKNEPDCLCKNYKQKPEFVFGTNYNGNEYSSLGYTI